MSSPKILVIGLGSIGTRHFTNLKTLGFRDLVLVSSKKQRPEEWNDFEVFANLKDALQAHDYTHAFICSPTAIHLTQLTQLVEAKVPKIYLEKPVSHDLEGLAPLREARAAGIEILVGFDLRFDPGLIKVRQLLDENSIGKVYSANAFVGQYLPDWRPYEDHRKGMSALIEKGGGVMLDLIHEFDYLIWLMGKAASVSALYQQNPELEIETEDTADVLIKFSSGASGSIHLDYHQRRLIRNCIFTGSLGTVIWDLAARTVTLHRADKQSEVFDFSEYERNDRYLDIVRAFMSPDSDERICTFEQGLESLQLVVASKHSSQSNTILKLPIHS